MDTLERIKKIISEQLGCREEDIKPELSLEDDLGADQLDLVEIEMAVEEAFEFGMTTEEEESMKTVQDIIKIVEAHNK